MKVLICDHAEPLHRDLEREKNVLRRMLGADLEISVHEYDGDEAALVRAAQDADGILTSYLQFPRELIKQLPALRAISIEATGYNYVDTAACAERDVRVAVIGEYCTHEVADHTIALMLAVARRLKHYQREIEQHHRFDYNSTAGMPRLRGSTMGIIGLGKIGQQVALRAQAFGMQVVAHSPSCSVPTADRLNVRLVDLDQLFATSDIISLHARLTPETTNLLDAAAFAAMQRRPIIVNVSRGAMIDEVALVAALDAGRVQGAGLDVLRVETHAETSRSPLVGRDDVVITPHTAFYSDAALHDCQRIAAENLAHMLAGADDRVFRLVTG